MTWFNSCTRCTRPSGSFIQCPQTAAHDTTYASPCSGNATLEPFDDRSESVSTPSPTLLMFDESKPICSSEMVTWASDVCHCLHFQPLTQGSV